jgi:3-oxoacyl-[acyl-carrier protein] reductase
MSTRGTAPRAVVTGARRGLGAAIAARFERDGFQVVRIDREPSDGVVVCDIADPDAVARIADEVGPVDVLVNNAGVWSFGALEDIDPAEFARVLTVNVAGTFHCTRAFGRGMLERGAGSIVNIVSIAAAAANPQVGAYSASKAAVVALTRQTALEWGPRGVRANAVGPGLVPTEGTGTVYDDPAVRAARSQAVPLRRLGEVGDIADVVSFLASDAARYVTGQVLYADGGMGQALMTLLPRPEGVAGPRLATRDPVSVVQAHLAAVERADLTGMSADYHLEAVLERPDGRFEGRAAIADYFTTVPARLGDGRVRFTGTEREGDRVTVRWRIDGGPADGTSGSDTFTVTDGWITHQRVVLDRDDF